MAEHISFTAAYAELTRYVLQGVAALQHRDPASAVEAFARASRLAETANLGQEARVGSRRNLAMAYRMSGRLQEAQETVRGLLADPELDPDHRPYLLHELGTILNLACDPEAGAVLQRALELYADRESQLICGLDLADVWCQRGDRMRAYQFLQNLAGPDDRTQYPDACARVQITLARIALEDDDQSRTTDHLAAAREILDSTGEPILHTLWLATMADLEHRRGKGVEARRHIIMALEQCLNQSESVTAEVMRTVAQLFLRIVRNSGG